MKTVGKNKQIKAKKKVQDEYIDTSQIKAEKRKQSIINNDLLKLSFQRNLSFEYKDGKPKFALDSLDDCVKDNRINGLSGKPQDIVFTFFAKFGFIGWQICSILAQHWLISNACSISNKDCLRNGWNNVFIDRKKEETDEEKEESQEMLNKLFDIAQQKFNLTEKLLEWSYYYNVYGTAFIMPVYEGGDDEFYKKPFNIDGVKKGSFKGLSVIEPYWMIPSFESQDTTDPTSPTFLEPEYYYTNTGKKIHKSHLIIGRRKFVSDILKPSYYYGGISLAQEIYERVYASERCANEAPLLLLTKRLTYYKVNLKNLFTNPAKYKELGEVLTSMRDNQGILFSSKDDEVGQLDTTLSDLDEVIMKQYHIASAIARIPVDKMFGTNPTGGLSASGDYNIKNYNQDLNTLQNDLFRPAIDKLNQIILKSEFDRKDRVGIIWNSTDNPTEKEIAELNEKKANTMAVYLQNGLITPEEARQKLVNDKMSGYSFLKGVELEEPTEEEQKEIEEMMNKDKGTKDEDNTDVEWITVKGNHIPIKEGQTKEEAIKEFLESKKEDGTHKKIEGLNEPSKEDTFINVPYSEKEEAKSLGAKWNPEKKSWYIPKGIYNEDFCKWYKTQAEDNGKLKEIKSLPLGQFEIKKELADNVVAIRETKKAYLLKKDNVEFWVQKRWVREDGTLTKAGEKAYNKQIETNETKKKLHEDFVKRTERLEKNGVEFNKVWENEKSVATDVTFQFYSMRTEDYENYNVRIFIPKSMLNEKGNAPLWLIKQKLDEAETKADIIASQHTLSGVGNAVRVAGLEDMFENKAEDKDITNKPKVYTIVDGKIYEIEEK